MEIQNTTEINKPKRTRAEHYGPRKSKVLKELTVNAGSEVQPQESKKSGKRERKFKQKTLKEFGHSTGRNKIRKNRILEEKTQIAEKVTISQDPNVTVTLTKHTVGKGISMIVLGTYLSTIIHLT